MKIYYLSNSIIPSISANSVHVMKMCSAFSNNNHQVSLFYRKPDSQTENIFQFYNVEDNFNLHYNEWPNIRGGGGLVYGAKVKKEIEKMELPDLFYGRDIYSIYNIIEFGRPIIFEAHTPPQNFLHKFIQKKLFKNNNFKKLVVISNALKKEFLRIFPNLDEDKICVAPDAADIPCLVNSPRIDHHQEGYKKM